MPHATQHANVNDAVEALEKKVGFSSSTSGAGIVQPSTSVGDVFYVSDTSGRTRWGPAAMVKLGEVISTSAGTGGFSFTNIPATFRALRVVARVRSNSSGGAASILGLQFNGDTGANYDRIGSLFTNVSVSVAESFGSTLLQIGMAAGSTNSSHMGFAEANIPAYGTTSAEKGVLAFAGFKVSLAAAGLTGIHSAGFWRSTAAITRVDVLDAGGNMSSGGIVTLWGLPQ